MTAFILPPGARCLTVTRNDLLTPNMRRLRLEGNELLDFALGASWWGPYFKLLVPGADQALARRTYSVRSFDAVGNTLDFDVVIHEPRGPASAWAVLAAPGDTVAILGPGGAKVEGNAGWMLLAGDHSALPAIAYTLERLPAHCRGRTFIALNSSADRQVFTKPPGVEVEWLPDGQALDAAVIEAAWPSDGDAILWAGAEAAVARRIRDYGRKVRGLGRDRCIVENYWRRGLTEGEFSYVD